MTYNLCLFYISALFCIVEMKVNDILFLANNNFASIKENAIKSAKIMKKDKEYFTSANHLKFNNAQIKLNPNGIVLIKESYIGQILLIIDDVVDFTSSTRII